MSIDSEQGQLKFPIVELNGIGRVMLINDAPDRKVFVSRNITNERDPSFREFDVPSGSLIWSGLDYRIHGNYTETKVGIPPAQSSELSWLLYSRMVEAATVSGL